MKTKTKEEVRFPKFKNPFRKINNEDLIGRASWLAERDSKEFIESETLFTSATLLKECERRTNLYFFCFYEDYLFNNELHKQKCYDNFLIFYTKLLGNAVIKELDKTAERGND